MVKNLRQDFFFGGRGHDANSFLEGDDGCRADLALLIAPCVNPLQTGYASIRETSDVLTGCVSIKIAFRELIFCFIDMAMLSNFYEMGISCVEVVLVGLSIDWKGRCSKLQIFVVSLGKYLKKVNFEMG
ncbi:hypothetical protein QZM22_08275 [Burkholderia oklahomensis]|uniref:hypothetical protein n=1 Tax=Burkholderia oklahomensis TaxID=342113 RepID=UPI00264D1019|nr:hypothetical protein [Burkholderia oklahomensis]MDN7672511.1 hypothetical protein [Burkholderia oklahomensis]